MVPSARTITVTNDGPGSAEFRTSLSGNAAWFRVSPSVGVLAEGVSSIITIQPVIADPSANLDEAQAAVNINGLAGTLGGGSVSVRVGIRGARIIFPEDRRDLGDVPLGSMRTGLTSVTNYGNEAAEIVLSTTGDGAFTSTFEDGTRTPHMVPAHGTLAIRTTFAPTDAGPARHQLSVTSSSAACSEDVSPVQFVGHGAAGELRVGEGVVFPSTLCGQRPPDQQLTITNSGSAVVNWSASIPGAGAPFTVTPTSGTLGAGMSQQITVRAGELPFPATPGRAASGFIYVVSDEPDAVPRIVPVRLQQEGAVLVFDDAQSVEILEAETGGTATSRTYTLRNTGNRESTVELATSFPEVFSVSAPGPVVIPAGGAHSFTITASIADGTRYTTHVFTSSSTNLCRAAGQGPTFIAQTPGALVVGATAVSFGNVRCDGTSVPQQLIPVRNTSTVETRTVSVLLAEGTHYDLKLDGQPLADDGEFELPPQRAAVIEVVALAPPPGFLAGPLDTVLSIQSGVFRRELPVMRNVVGARLAWEVPERELTGLHTNATIDVDIAVLNFGNIPARVRLTNRGISRDVTVPAAINVDTPTMTPGRAVVPVPITTTGEAMQSELVAMTLVGQGEELAPTCVNLPTEMRLTGVTRVESVEVLSREIDFGDHILRRTPPESRPIRVRNTGNVDVTVTPTLALGRLFDLSDETPHVLAPGQAWELIVIPRTVEGFLPGRTTDAVMFDVAGAAVTLDPVDLSEMIRGAVLVLPESVEGPSLSMEDTAVRVPIDVRVVGNFPVELGVQSPVGVVVVPPERNLTSSVVGLRGFHAVLSAPPEEGPITASFQVAVPDDAPIAAVVGNPVTGITISARAAAQIALLSPNVVDIGQTPCGTAAPSALTRIVNHGSQPQPFTITPLDGATDRYTLTPMMGSVPAHSHLPVEIAPHAVPQDLNAAGIDPLDGLVARWRVTSGSVSSTLEVVQRPKGGWYAVTYEKDASPSSTSVTVRLQQSPSEYCFEQGCVPFHMFVATLSTAGMCGITGRDIDGFAFLGWSGQTPPPELPHVTCNPGLGQVTVIVGRYAPDGAMAPSCAEPAIVNIAVP